VLDRASGKLLSANQFEKVTWATHVDLTTGRPVETELGRKVRAGEWIEKWPGTRGAKNWPHAAFDPNTGLLYANTMHAARMYRFLPVEAFKPGQRYMFIEGKDPLNRPPTCRSATSKRSTRFPRGHSGARRCMTSRTGEQCWRRAAGCCSPVR